MKLNELIDAEPLVIRLLYTLWKRKLGAKLRILRPTGKKRHLEITDVFNERDPDDVNTTVVQYVVNDSGQGFGHLNFEWTIRWDKADESWEITKLPEYFLLKKIDDNEA